MKRGISATCLGLALLSTGATISRSAFAESDPMTARAATLYDEAMVAFDAKKWPAARASLLAAWALKRHWQIAGSLAEVEMKLGLFRDAAEHLAFFLRHAPPERRTDAMLALSTTARANVGTITLKLDALDADVRLDGDPVGRTPLEGPVFVEPGNHRIEVHQAGKAASVYVDVVAGDRKEVELTMRSLDLYHAPPPPDAPAPPASPSGPGWGWVLASGVLGLGGLGAGLGLTIAANTKASEAARDLAQLGGSSTCARTPLPASCSTLASAVTSKDALSNGAVAALVVGGTFALTSVALGVWQTIAERPTKTSSAASALTVLPSIGRDGGALTVRAVW